MNAIDAVRTAPTTPTALTSAPVLSRSVTSAAADLDLRTRAEAGGTLSPVEQGTLARVADKQVSKPKTVADFTLIGATKQDRADLKAALEYLQQKDAKGNPISPTATKLLADLPAGAKLRIVHNGADQYNPNNKTISWDPRSGLSVSNGTGTQSPALGLIHEIDHAVNGQARPTLTGDGYENTEEKRVITGSETQIAHDLGEPTRTDHYGSLTVEKTSTAHTKVDWKAAAEAAQTAVEKAVDTVRELFRHLF